MKTMALKTNRKSKKAESIISVVNDAVDNPNETDDQIIERLRMRFEILDEMTQASIDGVVRGMVVSGPPGVGKTYGVEQVLEKDGIFDMLMSSFIGFWISLFVFKFYRRPIQRHIRTLLEFNKEFKLEHRIKHTQDIYFLCFRCFILWIGLVLGMNTVIRFASETFLVPDVWI